MIYLACICTLSVNAKCHDVVYFVNYRHVFANGQKVTFWCSQCFAFMSLYKANHCTNTRVEDPQCYAVIVMGREYITIVAQVLMRMVDPVAYV